ncbi:hypothetical protein ACO0K2_10785 [Undibacterium sp. MH2W]|uniref:hypothetical protein n=1 Tax=Undibacterium sp. MH2W TaxID=3413044 RepID=UPI003BF3CA67
MEIVRLGREGLIAYLENQVASFFPDGRRYRDVLEANVDEALARTMRCVNHVKMWTPDKFDYLHSTQYCIFLYFLSNTIYRHQHSAELQTKLFLLNKALNGIDLFYEIAMPDIFFIGHSVGIVLAKATYGNYLVLYQNSTVGKNHGIAPVLGEGVIMYPNSAIIGDCQIADGSVISQGVSVINKNTAAHSLVFQGEGGQLVFKKDQRNILSDFFRLN